MKTTFFDFYTDYKEKNQKRIKEVFEYLERVEVVDLFDIEQSRGYYWFTAKLTNGEVLRMFMDDEFDEEKIKHETMTITGMKYSSVEQLIVLRLRLEGGDPVYVPVYKWMDEGE